MTEHPLGSWLRRRKLRAYLFAKENGISFGALYKQLRGAVPNPSYEVMRKIEAGTGNRVSIKKQTDWLKENKKK